MKCKSILVKTADVYASRGSHCSIQVKRLARLTEGPLGGVENFSCKHQAPPVYSKTKH